MRDFISKCLGNVEFGKEDIGFPPEYVICTHINRAFGGKIAEGLTHGSAAELFSCICAVRVAMNARLAPTLAIGFLLNPKEAPPQADITREQIEKLIKGLGTENENATVVALCDETSVCDVLRIIEAMVDAKG